MTEPRAAGPVVCACVLEVNMGLDSLEVVGVWAELWETVDRHMDQQELSEVPVGTCAIVQWDPLASL